MKRHMGHHVGRFQMQSSVSSWCVTVLGHWYTQSEFLLGFHSIAMWWGHWPWDWTQSPLSFTHGKWGWYYLVHSPNPLINMVGPSDLASPILKLSGGQQWVTSYKLRCGPRTHRWITKALLSLGKFQEFWGFLPGTRDGGQPNSSYNSWDDESL